jgi:hypothetical protein
MFTPIYQQNFDQAKFYYQVGNKKTFNKTQAIIWADKQIDKIRFWFMDDIFDQLDWTNEPSDNFNSLLARRAQQIREQYDWVSISYSGGYDSQTMVDAFMHNGLLLDEIIVLKKPYLPEDDWVNLEADIAISQARLYKNHVWPKLSIKVIELSVDYTKDFFLKHKNNWIEHAGNDLWITRMSRQHLYNYQVDYANIVESRISKVIVEGREKPRLWIENGEWYATMIDALANWDINSKSVLFYYDPELYRKQAWGMLNWLESFPLTTVDEIHTLLHQVQSHKTNVEIYRDWNYSLGRNPVHNMYSYDPLVFKRTRWSGDPRTIKETQVLSKHFENTQVLSYYNAGISEYMEQYGDTVLDPQKWNVWSKKYFIKKVEPGKNCKTKLML